MDTEVSINNDPSKSIRAITMDTEVSIKNDPSKSIRAITMDTEVSIRRIPKSSGITVSFSISKFMSVILENISFKMGRFFRIIFA